MVEDQLISWGGQSGSQVSTGHEPVRRRRRSPGESAIKGHGLACRRQARRVQHQLWPAL